MDRWTKPREVVAFLAEIEAVCRKHGMSISHEGAHGGFIIEPLSQNNIDWLREAMNDFPVWVDRPGNTGV